MTSNRYSPLDEITSENVPGLKLAYAVPLGGGEANALGNGSMEGHTARKRRLPLHLGPVGHALQVRRFGRQDGRNWSGSATPASTRTQAPASSWRTVASRLSGNLVIGGLNDGRVIACDNETGDVVWDKQIGQRAG